MDINIISMVIISLITVLVPFLGITFIISIFRRDELKKKVFGDKVQKNIKNEFNSEFETIYNHLINSDLAEAKAEKNKNIVNCTIACILFITIIIYIVTASIHTVMTVKNASEVNAFILSIPSIFLGIIAVMFYMKKKTVKYKDQVIKNFIYFINPQIEYEARAKTREESEIYKKAMFRDSSADRSYITDSMKYQLDNNTSVILEDLLLMTGGSGSNSNSREVFNGIIAEISRDKTLNTDILIERNRLFKSFDRIKDASAEFEKYFDLCSENDVSLVMTQSIKDKLVYLYEHYKIMFEISLKGNNIYIRFFSGKMFESNVFEKLVNKNKLYKEYVIFTNILNIIKEVNELF